MCTSGRASAGASHTHIGPMGASTRSCGWSGRHDACHTSPAPVQIGRAYPREVNRQKSIRRDGGPMRIAVITDAHANPRPGRRAGGDPRRRAGCRLPHRRRQRARPVPCPRPGRPGPPVRAAACPAGLLRPSPLSACDSPGGCRSCSLHQPWRARLLARASGALRPAGYRSGRDLPVGYPSRAV
jgi:hypothetical protein